MFFMNRLAAEAMSLKAGEDQAQTSPQTLSSPSGSPPRSLDSSPHSTLLHDLLSGGDANMVGSYSGLLKDNDNQSNWPRRTNSLSLPRNRPSAFRPRSSTILNGTNGVATPASGADRRGPYSRPAEIRTGQDHPVDLTKSINTSINHSSSVSSSSLLKSMLNGQVVKPDGTLFYKTNGVSASSTNPQSMTNRSFSMANCSSNFHYQSHVESIVESMFTSNSSPQISKNLISNEDYISPVQLAKKNLFPVQSRISEWLKQIAEFTQRKFPKFNHQSENVQLYLLSKFWHRLLIISMIQSNFSFTVSAFTSTVNSESSSPDLLDPTLGFTRELKELILDGQILHLDDSTFDSIRILIVSQYLYPQCSSESYDDVNLRLTNQLGSINTYSKVLLLINKMYGFEPEVMRRLFCTHLPSHLSVEAAILSTIET